jgi:enoyl-CoA hydratase
MADPLRPGDRASIEHEFGPEDVAAFAQLSGDDNPIHRDAAAARLAGFDREIVHGVLVLSLISRLLGRDLPGPGTILLGQDLRYLRPVYVGDRVTAHVEILAVREDKPVVQLRMWVETDGIAIDGTATVLVRPLGQPPTGSEPGVRP